MYDKFNFSPFYHENEQLFAKTLHFTRMVSVPTRCTEIPASGELIVRQVQTELQYKYTRIYVAR